MKGQAKKDFEKWYSENRLSKQASSTSVSVGESFISLSQFKRINPSLQYGVIVDWFDSVGIVVDILKTDYDKMFNFEVYNEQNSGLTQWSGKEKTRPQARQKAIDKAVEIYNIKNK